MADYPNAKKNFTALIDGTTYMEAVNVNVVYDEVEATQLFLGASGATQTYNSSVLELLAENYRGLEVRYSDTDELSITAGQAIISNVTGSIKRLRGNSSATVITISNLDTGSMAEGYYYIYAVADASGSAIAFTFSVSDSAPTGYTQYKKIGWFYNETASVLDVTLMQFGNIKDGSDNPNAVQVEGDDDITTTSTSFVDMTDMEINFVSNGRPVMVHFMAPMRNNAHGVIQYTCDVDGTDQAIAQYDGTVDAEEMATMPYSFLLKDLDAGEHTLKIQWKVDIGTAQQQGSTTGARIFTVHEL